MLLMGGTLPLAGCSRLMAHSKKVAAPHYWCSHSLRLLNIIGALAVTGCSFIMVRARIMAARCFWNARIVWLAQQLRYSPARWLLALLGTIMAEGCSQPLVHSGCLAARIQ
jgi:hypothetical protein